MILKRDIDIRKDVYAHIVLSSSTTIFQRIGTVDVALTTMSFKVVAPPERKYWVLLLAILGLMMAGVLTSGVPGAQLTGMVGRNPPTIPQAHFLWEALTVQRAVPRGLNG